MIPAWAGKPEMIVTYLLSFLSVVLSAVFSLYSQEIKAFIAKPFVKARGKQLLVEKAHLAQLDDLHGNAYGLLLFLSFNLLDAVRRLFYSWIASIFLLLVVIFFHQSNAQYWIDEWRMLFPSAVIGIVIGRIIYLHGTLLELWSFVSSRNKILSNIQKLSGESGRPQV